MLRCALLHRWQRNSTVDVGGIREEKYREEAQVWRTGQMREEWTVVRNPHWWQRKVIASVALSLSLSLSLSKSNRHFTRFFFCLFFINDTCMSCEPLKGILNKKLTNEFIWHISKVWIVNWLNSKYRGSKCNPFKIQGVYMHFTLKKWS